MPERKKLADAIRVLSMDAVQKANSGHPGAPMGMADIAEVLWNDFLVHNPGNPDWDNRDRFVLSNGHASMLIYSMLHLTGYDLALDEIKHFRQLDSKTPGHPECDMTPGVENTSGPLGQGVTNAVGMALAECMLAETFNRDGFPIVDHHTYAFLGDGCLMEGISHEACSLAGTLGLGKLIVLYDDNGISIDGPVDGWFRDNTPDRFKAYGWQVIDGVDGHDAAAVKKALEQARAESGKPSLICCKTTIGYGSPAKGGTSACHGAPLGDDEIAVVRDKLGWEHPPFEIPDDIYQAFDGRPKGAEAEAAWHKLFDEYKAAHPELAAEYERRMKGQFPAGFEAKVAAFMEEKRTDAAKLATRKSSLAALDAFSQLLPEIVGGSADLAGSNGVKWSGKKDVVPGDFSGNYINFGVREFAMGAICNGMALHGGFIPYAATFLVFSDYARNSIRMASIMEQRVVWILTHDSIGVGEDGPTHQPVEHNPSLRIIPGVTLWRPCDTYETFVAWKASLEQTHGPSALSLTRQGLDQMERDQATAANVARGGYVLSDCNGEPQALIIATGSEMAIALAACKELNTKGVKTRLVSMPSENVFAAQDQAYKDQVLPPSVTARVAVEAGQPDLWYKYVGLAGEVVGMDGFGKSAPGAALFDAFGFTKEAVMQAVERSLSRS